MALEQKLSLKLAQKLVMTPSLQQAIKLLQMTRMELDTLLTQELVENPVLEESTEVTEEETPPREEERPEPPTNGEELNHGESMENIDLDAYFGDYWEGSGHSSMMEEREEPPIENSLTREPDLYDHLLWQLHMADVAPRQREIAELIIGNLDPDGFLVASPEEIQAMGDQTGGDYSLDEVLAGLALVRALDPPGIACANLQESLLLQMDVREVAPDDLARRMVSEAWDLFLRRQFPAVAKKLGVELAELEEAVELVRTLETHPGRRFSTDRPHYIEPDVFVRRVGEEYVIQLNDDGLPRLRVSRAYRRMP